MNKFQYQLSKLMKFIGQKVQVRYATYHSEEYVYEDVTVKGFFLDKNDVIQVNYINSKNEDKKIQIGQVPEVYQELHNYH